MPRPAVVAAALVPLGLALTSCGGSSGDAIASICGGEVSSAPVLCDLVVEPARVLVGGSVTISSFGLADREGDIVAACVGVSLPEARPTWECFPVRVPGGMLNDRLYLSGSFRLDGPDGSPLPAGSYVVSFIVGDAADRLSNVVTAPVLIEGASPAPTPLPTPAPTPAPSPPVLGTSNVWYASWRRDTHESKLCVTNLEGLEPTCIADLDRVQGEPLSVSAGGRVVAYPGRAPSGYNDVFVMNGDGTGKRRVSDTRWWDHHVVVGPDGARVAWEHDFEILTVGADGGGFRRLATGGRNTRPRFAPDGRRVVYDHLQYTPNFDGSPPSGLYVVDAETGEGRALRAGVQVHDVAFLPDGETVVFSADLDGAVRFCSVGLDGAGFTVLATPAVPPSAGFDLGPDGREVVYAAGADLYLLDLDTGGSRPLLDDEFARTKQAPRFSPDGRKVVFATLVDPVVLDFDLFVIDVDGAGLRPLTEGPTSDQEPVWR